MPDQNPPNPEDQAQEPAVERAPQEGESGTRHPTGFPESTGGWYGESDKDEGEMSSESKEDDTLPQQPTPTPPPPPSIGRTPMPSPPALGTRGLPLPRRVDEIDTDATRVSPAAYVPPLSRRRTQGGVEARPVMPPTVPPQPPKEIAFDWQTTVGCLVRMIILAVFGLVTLGLCGASFVIFQYYHIARNLPNVEELRQRASQFETTRILDREGNELYEILDPNAGRRTYVRLDKISPFMVAATIATEDKEFYSHPGFDVFAIFRAFWQNYTTGEVVSGASTITQQLARSLLFTPEERSEQTYQRKIREAVLAAEITRRYTKDEILELYINEIYYGNLAYGVEAAAETYFKTTAEKLTLGQAAFLAGLPQAPAVYDVYTNRELALERMEQVLVLMYHLHQEQGCIYVSNTPQPVCLDPVAVTAAVNEMRTYNFNSPDIQMRYPHWVNYVRFLLEAQYDPQTIYRAGFSIYTTLDARLQDQAEQIVRQQIANLADRHATDGALIAIKPTTGEILAMVGSSDFYNEAISGQVNMAVAPRQPGSSIKPLTYLAAFEKGWTPATLIWDVPSEFPPSGDPNDPRPPYKPVNYDGRFHGPVTVRYALANSYNVPAVKALNFVGIYDDPNTPVEDGLIAFARRAGISTLNRPDYGLSLTLGGGEVTLLELTGVYATLANGGRRIPPVAITRILDHFGNVVYEYRAPPGEQVFRPEHAFLITSILSDNQARTPAFGPSSVLNLPFPAAAKTGTTDDFRDNWTIGYTTELATGVWVGNADYTPMQNITGLTGAAPIWSEFMQIAIPILTSGQLTPFVQPNGVVEKAICEISGTAPSHWCPSQRTELFAADQPPLPASEDLWQKVQVDTWTNLKVSTACADFTDERFVFNVKDPWAIQWLRKDTEGVDGAEKIGFARPITFTPERECRADDPRPVMAFTSPRNAEIITSNPLDIYGQVDATQWFDYYQLFYGIGQDPVQWVLLDQKNIPFRQPDILYRWEVKDLPAGIYTLRLFMHSTEDTYAEAKISIDLQVPTPTPTPTGTPTPTYTATVTAMPSTTHSITPTPSNTPHLPKATFSPTPSPTEPSFPIPSDTPVTTPGAP